MELAYQALTGAPPPHSTQWVDDVLAGVPGQLGALVSRGMSMSDQGLAGTVITLWPETPTDLPTGIQGTIRLAEPQHYRLVHLHGDGLPGPARYLQVAAFDGPREARWSAAFERSSTDRIWPAMTAVPGILGALLCQAEDGAALALTLATSVEALEAGLAAVMSTELLPGEDPALLTGPDRVDIHRLLHAELPAEQLQGSAGPR